MLAFFLITAVFNITACAGLTEELIEAVKMDDRVQVEALLKRGADVNGTGQYGETPLMFAAGYGSMKLVKFLISKGVKVAR